MCLGALERPRSVAVFAACFSFCYALAAPRDSRCSNACVFPREAWHATCSASVERAFIERMSTRVKERYMRHARIHSSSFLAVMLLGALGGCTPGSNSANDVADEVGKALDPAPDYVDEPAREPQKPE
jgi:hypothetical protein